MNVSSRVPHPKTSPALSGPGASCQNTGTPSTSIICTRACYPPRLGRDAPDGFRQRRSSTAPPHALGDTVSPHGHRVALPVGRVIGLNASVPVPSVVAVAILLMIAGLVAYAVRPVAPVAAPVRLALLRAAVIMAAVAVVTVEGASAAHALTTTSVTLVWLGVLLVAVFAAWSRRRG